MESVIVTIAISTQNIMGKGTKVSLAKVVAGRATVTQDCRSAFTICS